jgi:hypothetical protein
MDTDHQHVIYVSYADADKDWVINFVDGLKVYLRKQLGELDDHFIWARYMLCGNENRLTVPQRHLQQSKCLLTILSPAYLKTIGNSEIDLFDIDDNNVFIVKCDSCLQPDKLHHFGGYKFWHEDKTGNVIRWANPEPTAHDREYYSLLDRMARDIAKVVNEPEVVTPAQLSPDVCESQPIPEVFINSTEEDRAVALGVQDHLYRDERLNKNIGFRMLPDTQVGLSPQEVQKELEENLLNCDTAIVICDQAPLKWVYQQIQSIFKLSVKRKREKKLYVKIVVVNKPPPCNLEELLGLKFPNLKVSNCAEIADCMSNITEVILS